jgi:hypothetical protein
MMEAESVSETLVGNPILTWLIAQEAFMIGMLYLPTGIAQGVRRKFLFTYSNHSDQNRNLNYPL